MAKRVGMRFMQLITKSLIVFIISCTLFGCVHGFSCDAVTKSLLEKQASIIIKNIDPSGRSVNFSGIDINTGSNSFFIDEGGMYLPMKQIVQTGDTLLKRKGQTSFLVKKKLLIFKFTCIENQGYGFDIDTLKREINL